MTSEANDVNEASMKASMKLLTSLGLGRILQVKESFQASPSIAIEIAVLICTYL